MSNEEKKQIKQLKKFEKQKLKEKKEFYDYKYWREVQRNQLGVSANLYFIFSSAIFGYVINFTIVNKDDFFHCEIYLLIPSLIFLLISFLFYALFTENRLKDFRKTAELINDNSVAIENIPRLTKKRGVDSWSYYNLQRYSLLVGFIFALIGLSIFIFK